MAEDEYTPQELVWAKIDETKLYWPAQVVKATNNGQYNILIFNDPSLALAKYPTYEVKFSDANNGKRRRKRRSKQQKEALNKVIQINQAKLLPWHHRKKDTYTYISNEFVTRMRYNGVEDIDENMWDEWNYYALRAAEAEEKKLTRAAKLSQLETLRQNEANALQEATNVENEKIAKYSGKVYDGRKMNKETGELEGWVLEAGDEIRYWVTSNVTHECMEIKTKIICIHDKYGTLRAKDFAPIKVVHSAGVSPGWDTEIEKLPTNDPNDPTFYTLSMCRLVPSQVENKMEQEHMENHRKFEQRLREKGWGQLFRKNNTSLPATGDNDDNADNSNENEIELGLQGRVRNIINEIGVQGGKSSTMDASAQSQSTQSHSYQLRPRNHKPNYDDQQDDDDQHGNHDQPDENQQDNESSKNVVDIDSKTDDIDRYMKIISAAQQQNKDKEKSEKSKWTVGLSVGVNIDKLYDAGFDTNVYFYKREVLRGNMPPDPLINTVMKTLNFAKNNFAKIAVWNEYTGKFEVIATRNETNNTLEYSRNIKFVRKVGDKIEDDKEPDSEEENIKEKEPQTNPDEDVEDEDSTEKKKKKKAQKKDKKSKKNKIKKKKKKKKKKKTNKNLAIKYDCLWTRTSYNQQHYEMKIKFQFTSNELNEIIKIRCGSFDPNQQYTLLKSIYTKNPNVQHVAPQPIPIATDAFDTFSVISNVSQDKDIEIVSNFVQKPPPPPPPEPQKPIQASAFPVVQTKDTLPYIQPTTVLPPILSATQILPALPAIQQQSMYNHPHYQQQYNYAQFPPNPSPYNYSQVPFNYSHPQQYSQNINNNAYENKTTKNNTDDALTTLTKLQKANPWLGQVIAETNVISDLIKILISVQIILAVNDKYGQRKLAALLGLGTPATLGVVKMFVNRIIYSNRANPTSKLLFASQQNASLDSVARKLFKCDLWREAIKECKQPMQLPWPEIYSEDIGLSLDPEAGITRTTEQFKVDMRPVLLKRIEIYDQWMDLKNKTKK